MKGSPQAGSVAVLAAERILRAALAPPALTIVPNQYTLCFGSTANPACATLLFPSFKAELMTPNRQPRRERRLRMKPYTQDAAACLFSHPVTNIHTPSAIATSSSEVW